MKDLHIYNSRIIKNYIEYLRRHFPEIDLGAILDHAKMTTYQLEDEGHWFTQEQIDRFHEIVSLLTKNPMISREVGRYSASSEASGAIKQYLLGFVTPAAAYALVEKIAAKLTRGHSFRTKSLGPNSIEVVSIPNPGIQEKIYQCENRMGTLEALAKIFTDRYAKIDHPVCVHRGDDRCVYHVTWEKSPSLIWKRIRNGAILMSLPVCVSLLLLAPLSVSVSAIFFYLAFVFGISYYAEHIDRQKLVMKVETQGDAANRLIEQINLSYNNTLLVQEIGQATSMILDIDQLLAFVMEALKNRLDFDRGMIMLANREKTRLLYYIGYGYDQEQQESLENIEFHLDNPESKGVFVLSFKNQIPLLINDVSEIERDLSRKSLEFARRMGTHAFICVPIVFTGESMGILVVDNIHSKRTLNQSDMNLLMGIAPQIAISINNAISYRKVMESEQRFRSLSESAPDIIYTVDTRGVFTYVNPAWQRILGHHSQEVIGKNFIDFTRKEEIPVYTDLFKQVTEGGGTVRSLIGKLLHKDGSDRFFSVSSAPNLDSEGQVISVVGTFKDVTDLMISEEKLQQSFKKVKATLDSAIQAISAIVESRDPYTSGHQERVATLARTISRKMGLSEEMIESIHIAATLHDVGKINIPAEILSRPKQLNEIEMEMIRMHPEVGSNILKSIEFPYPIALIVLQHHERVNGSGYPMGIAGENILLEARILAVADVVEAMASHRPYRPALGIAKAMEELSRKQGELYDKEVVEVCLRLFKEDLFHF